VPAQALREGERFTLQLAGWVPGTTPGETQADGSLLRLEYGAAWLPAGATLDRESGAFAWTPSFNQHGRSTVPLTLTARWTAADGTLSDNPRRPGSAARSRQRQRRADLPGGGNVERCRRIAAAHQRLRLRPGQPRVRTPLRLHAGAAAVGPATTPPTVRYQVDGLPPGAVFDSETLEIVWTPGYDQAGLYEIFVTASDDGDPSPGVGPATATPASSQLAVTIVVSNANRAPTLGPLANVSVDAGGEIEIPVSAVDADADAGGTPITLSFAGLPRFARYVPLARPVPAKPPGCCVFPRAKATAATTRSPSRRATRFLRPTWGRPRTRGSPRAEASC
jgi:hypothetical protein